MIKIKIKGFKGNGPTVGRYFKYKALRDIYKVVRITEDRVICAWIGDDGRVDFPHADEGGISIREFVRWIEDGTYYYADVSEASQLLRDFKFEGYV